MKRQLNPYRSLAWLPLALASACSEPALDTTTYRCESDEECSDNQICAPFDDQRACLARSSVPLTIGMSGPLQGPSQDLGTEMRRGIEAQFERVNREGGFFGRPLLLESLNDNYDPAQAVQMVRQLLDVEEVTPGINQADRRGIDGVFALLGNIGTPTMLQTAPIANKNKVLFFGPFTGAQQYLRDGTSSPYVYNYRAGYYDEMSALIDYIANARIPQIVVNAEQDFKRILVFAQNDSFGDAGLNGVRLAYNRQIGSLPDNSSIATVRYEREDVASVGPAVAKTKLFLSELLDNGSERQSAAIVMVDTYLPGNEFIRAIKNWVNEDLSRAQRLDILFSHVSFVGSDSLAESLTSTPQTYPSILDPTVQLSYAEGVMVTQVVPDYYSEAPAVTDYREDIARFDNAGYSYTSLEGYIVARLFVTALQRTGPGITTEKLRLTLNTQIRDLDIGIGPTLTFGPDDHQASDTVWGTRIEADGSFSVPFVWDRTNRIRSN